MRSTPEDLILWKQRIKERKKSGMSVSEWCKINEVSKHKYHYWNNKINKNKKLDNEMDFAEVSSIISNTYDSEAAQCKPDDFQIFFNNVHVTVPSNFNQDSLAGLMKVLQQL
ncbi:hypothetical protein [Clostridium sp. C8]|uniref:IS66 family insertion sequence element accessory protein TnpA n=1 Tax=Clostridium sp. C8 TaxID=1667357 RepID=UPI00062E89F8|nr:hypothetical protein [Clostridium sp. C8]KLE15591.1 hypothetical protein AAT22_10570 [Clostridium sp. C8]